MDSIQPGQGPKIFRALNPSPNPKDWLANPGSQNLSVSYGSPYINSSSLVAWPPDPDSLDLPRLLKPIIFLLKPLLKPSSLAAWPPDPDS